MEYSDQKIFKFTYPDEDKSIMDLLKNPAWQASLDDYRPPIQVPKRSGGFRTILEPKQYLKKAQSDICRRLGNLGFGASMYAHGFVIKRGRRSNALPHVGHKGFLKMDLHDFFGTCTPSGVLSALNYHGCPNWLYDAVKRICFLPDKGLPQGAPSSPMLANIAAREMDFRLAGLCRQFMRQHHIARWRVEDITYSRYADDLTFSSDWEDLSSFRYPATAVIEDCGFEVNGKKTRFFTRPKRIEVCGVVISDDKVNTRRGKRRFWRGRLHRMITDIKSGTVPQGHYRDQEGTIKPISARMMRSIQGHVAAVVDISPQDKPRLMGGVRELRSLV